MANKHTLTEAAAAEASWPTAAAAACTSIIYSTLKFASTHVGTLIEWGTLFGWILVITASATEPG